MSKQQTVTINNVQYDARTGMRIVNAPKSMNDVVRASAPASVHHKTTQRSNTLRRRTLESPVNVRTKTAAVAPVRSQMIKRFAADIAPAHPPKQRVQTSTPDIAPSLHPVQQKAMAKRTVQATNPAEAPAQPRPAHEIKQSVVAKALAESKPAKVEKQSFMKKHPRLLSVTSGIVMLLVLGGYLTYTNLPNLSVKVAAMQAGIAASFPSYQPSGYSVDGPVTYKEGEVSMKFDANAGPQEFTITQQKSSWDSSALLENYVSQISKSQYNTYSDSGLTVYVYGTNAAWVNGGILHTIEGDAPLTNQQIRKIATSM